MGKDRGQRGVDGSRFGEMREEAEDSQRFSMHQVPSDGSIRVCISEGEGQQLWSLWTHDKIHLPVKGQVALGKPFGPLLPVTSLSCSTLAGKSFRLPKSGPRILLPCPICGSLGSVFWAQGYILHAIGVHKVLMTSS